MFSDGNRLAICIFASRCRPGMNNSLKSETTSIAIMFYDKIHKLVQAKTQMPNTYFFNENIDNFLHTLLDGQFVSIKHQVGLFGWLVGLVDAGEAADLALVSLLIESLGVTSFAHLERRGHKALDEGQAGLLVNLPRPPPIAREWTDAAGQCNRAAVGKQTRHLGNATNVFASILFTKFKVRVEAMPNVVAIEGVAVYLVLGEVIVHRKRYCRLARTRVT